MPGMTRKSAKNDLLGASAERRMAQILTRARKFAPLKKLAPAPIWHADVSVVGPGVMKMLNSQYRRKDHATDVLSFEAPMTFRRQGILGELVICSSVLRRQAREMGHKPELELEILLVHGLLHLLGFDHEMGARAAGEMRRWEEKLLGRSARRGLIARAE